MITLKDRYLGALVGLACGDAVGTTVEFSPRATFKPVTGMDGGGPFSLKPGQWTDDTSMALCLAVSLLEKGAFDPADQMTRYRNWMERGYLSSTGSCFDIGMTVRAALGRFQTGGDPYCGSTDPRSAGNGSLMRLAPVVLFAYPERSAMMRLAADSSRTTHAAPEAIECCQLFALLIGAALAGTPKDALLASVDHAFDEPKVAAIARGEFLSKSESQVFGTGYSVASLEASLWCFFNTDSFEEAVLRAANLGDDADTTAAITGQIAGAFHGIEGIPSAWRSKISMRDDVESMAAALFDRVDRPRVPSDLMRARP